MIKKIYNLLIVLGIGRLRTVFYTLAGAKIGSGTFILKGFGMTNPGAIKIGRNVKINHYVFMDGGGGIEIGDNVLIAPYVYLSAADHKMDNLQKPISEQGLVLGKIVIEDEAWIGAHVTILKNVTIGKGAVVAAGSVVTADVEPYDIVAGVPAKKIKSRKDN